MSEPRFGPGEPPIPLQPAQCRGIQRIDRMLADHVWPDTVEKQYIPAYPVPEWQLMSQSEVMVECTAALIEELHDALLVLSRPAYVVKAPP